MAVILLLQADAMASDIRNWRGKLRKILRMCNISHLRPNDLVATSHRLN